MTVSHLEIATGEAEFVGLLEREKATSDVRRAFPGQLKLLRDVVNYGTNLIPRSFNSSDKELKDLVVIGILLRQVVAMLDSVEVLLSAGAVYGSGLQARAIFEASVYIDWIFRESAAEKALYYYVHNVRRQRLWAKRLDPGTHEANEFATVAPHLQSTRSPEAIASAKQSIADIDANLALPKFAATNAAFDKAKRKNASNDVAWYSLLGMRSFRAIANAVGRTDAHDVFYVWWSGAMHSSDYKQHITIGDGTVTFEPFRILTNFAVLFQFAAATAFHTYRAVLSNYRPGEIGNFNRKYMERWRMPFMSIPRINYERHNIGPASEAVKSRH